MPEKPLPSDPQTLDDFQRLSMLGHHLEGRGLQTTVHSPCPFCAAPDFMIYSILEVQEVCSIEHTCTSCGRSSKFLYTGGPGNLQMELVQTGGPDVPDWFTSKPRRIASHEKGETE